MERAIERHNQGDAYVIPILLRPVHWDRAAPFAKLQIVPTNAIPVTTWANHDTAFRDVTGHIARVLSKRRNARPQILPVANVGDQQTNALSALPSLQLIAKPEAITILRTFTGHTQEVLSVALSADGRTLVSRSLDQTVKAWNVQTGQILFNPDLWKNYTVASIALSADGRILAIGYSSGYIQLCNVQIGKYLGYLPLLDQERDGHHGAITSVALSADGRVLASGDVNGEILLWNTQTSLVDPNERPEPLIGIPSRRDAVVSLALSADGSTLASGGPSGNGHSIKLTDTHTRLKGRLTSNWFDHKGAITSVALSADGQMVASGSFDGKTKLWSVRKSKLICTLKDMAKDVALNADGQILATASSSTGTAKLWNAKTGRVLRTLTLQTGSVSSVALSTDGRILASGNSDGTINIWGIK
jgi:WD40 repeat protein